jgi:hypothetical protein
VHQFVLSAALSSAMDVRGVGAIGAAPPGTVFYLIYIDDLVIISDTEEGANQVLEAAIEAYHAAGLHIKPSKVKRAAPSMEALGVVLDAARQSYYVKGEKLAVLIAATRQVCTAPGPVSVEIVRSLIGRWIWAALVRRPVLAVMNHVFRFCRLEKPRCHLWASVRQELLTLCALAPVLSGSTADWAEAAVATDASTWGYGVCATSVAPASLLPMTQCTETRGEAVRVHGAPPAADMGGERMVRAECVNQWAEEQEWVTVLSKAWRMPAHINVLEVIASTLGLRWVARQPRLCSKRFVFLSDSQVAVGALSKGRSSAFPLIGILRRFAGIALAADIHAAFAWVGTHFNPADAPSRGINPKPQSRSSGGV